MANQICLCGHAHAQCIMAIEDKGQCDNSPHNLVDDGTAGDVAIPAVIMLKQDADEIKEVLFKGKHVEVELSFGDSIVDVGTEAPKATSPPNATTMPDTSATEAPPAEDAAPPSADDPPPQDPPPVQATLSSENRPPVAVVSTLVVLLVLDLATGMGVFYVTRLRHREEHSAPAEGAETPQAEDHEVI